MVPGNAGAAGEGTKTPTEILPLCDKILTCTLKYYTLDVKLERSVKGTITKIN